VASSSEPVAAHDGPDDASSVRLLDPADEVSGQLVFLVKDQVSDWLEVYLPVRPNGSTGWLRRGDVELSEHRYRIELSLSDRRLVVFRADDVIMDEPVGVGTEDTPTPGGVYYLKELLRPPDPDGFYGPYAYGLSGFSDTAIDYNGGVGVIGIHGTDDPSTIGRDVSHGCIRLKNESITRLVEEIGLPLGTPVIISA
jgi:lipoprotein-anchoring transpeptidase ErfK/SrfK